MPMWNSVANLKENLSKIALDVHEDDEEDLSIHTPPRDRFGNNDGGSERRISRIFAHSHSPNHSPLANGFDSPYNHEIEQYKTDIKRLKESEAEIKALSVNYAALLKEKEDQISRLSEENGSLKQNLITTNAALTASKAVLKGNGEVSPKRQNKASVKIRSSGNAQTNGIFPKQDGLNNGTTSVITKELTDMTEEKNKSMAMMQENHETKIKQMAFELDKERDALASMKIRLQEEKKLNGSFQQQMSSLKDQNDEMSKEITRLRDELNQKVSVIGRLHMETHTGNIEETNATLQRMKTLIATLENEKSYMKKERDDFEAALKAIRSSPDHNGLPGETDPSNKHLNENMEREKEEILQSMRNLERDLKETRREKEKVLQQLNRLKQHLLDKESEESEKMDEDSKIITELRETNELQRVQILQLEKALKQAIGGQEEIKMSNNNELKKCKEIIEQLNRKLSSYMSTIDAKNMEVLNLQTALGQYYAEIEAKERLGEELSVVKEESSRLSELLKEAHQEAEASSREKEELLVKLSQAEQMVIEGKNRVKKLEEDNDKMHRALGQSMTRLNRMSVDSDFLVDRRIVIKLLVTYFQRNHSKEVLDLMVRMLGFSDEDKQRIGVAQQGAGKGVVRGVFGLPGRLVGGIMGSGNSAEATNDMAENQTFADLWVDYLLKETEERGKRETNSSANLSNPDQHKGIQNATGTDLPFSGASNASRTIPYHNQNQSQLPFSSRGNFMQRENSESEFSTVPLTSSESNLQSSSVVPRY